MNQFSRFIFLLVAGPMVVTPTVAQTDGGPVPAPTERRDADRKALHVVSQAVPGSQPSSQVSAPQHPVIAGYGSVVKFATAAHQPRNGAKLLIDITQGSDVGQLNPGIEKVAKYVNIYAGAGKEPAKASFAVVLHGGATLAVLNPDAYTAKFNTKNNPHLDCLRQLHEAGVAIYVCGQSLLKEGGKPEEVVVFAETAVSALTAVVNLQADGYSYVPLLK